MIDQSHSSHIIHRDGLGSLNGQFKTQKCKFCHHLLTIPNLCDFPSFGKHKICTFEGVFCLYNAS